METNLKVLQYFEQRLKILDDVHFAMTNGYEVTTAFQRIVDKDNKLIGYEALLRPFQDGIAGTASCAKTKKLNVLID